MDDQNIYPPDLFGSEEDEDQADEPSTEGEQAVARPEEAAQAADVDGAQAVEGVPAEDQDSPDDSDEEPRRWWAMYTRARQEKALAREMFQWQIPFYLPLIPKTREYGRRRVRATIPLFAGYLFLYGTDDERVKSLTTNRVSRNLEVKDEAQLVAELSNLKRLIDAGAPLTMESRLAKGAPVRICRGPLSGVEGVVLKRHGQTRLLVSVNFLQKGASVAIEDFLLEPL